MTDLVGLYLALAKIMGSDNAIKPQGPEGIT